MSIRRPINLPGDKSISHRALMLSALAKGESRITNISTGDDVRSTKECLQSCGIQINKDDNITFVNGGTLSDPKTPLNCGNSGTTTRLLLGLLSGQGINATLTGDNSLSSRPMKRVLDPLKIMGLSAESSNGTLPIKIQKSALKGIHYATPISSAQVKSAILLAGLGALGDTTVLEKLVTRDHTEKMLIRLGAKLLSHETSSRISPLSTPLSSFEISVPGDPSTAAFFAAYAGILPGSEIIIKGILISPTRIGFLRILKKMGGQVSFIRKWKEAGELIGDIKITYNPLISATIRSNDIPDLIDELPIIAILATQANGCTTVRDAQELRVKECDRISAICYNLKNMGADIVELDDGFIINGPTHLKGTKIKTYHDHRIAMAFTIAGLIADGETVLDNPDCIGVSYPEFFQTIEYLNK